MSWASPGYSPVGRAAGVSVFLGQVISVGDREGPRRKGRRRGYQDGGEWA